MKFFVLLATFVGLAASQSLDLRCPRGPNDDRPDSFGHPTDCRRFFRCFNGMALELSCPSGRMWSSHSNTCELEHLSDCLVQIQPLPEHRRPMPDQRPNRPMPEIQPNPDFMQCPVFDIPGEFVYFPHRTDCRQFFQCSAGRAVQLECPPGFMWNIERTFCDQQQNVRCITPRGL